MNPRILIISIISIILAFLLPIYMAGTFLSSPSPGEIGDPPVDLAAQQVHFYSKSGSTISGWFIPGQEHKGGILLMHGVRSNRLQMVERARFLNGHGYSVLLFDFQSHGVSPGKHITFGYLEAFDAEAAFSFLENRLSQKTIGVIGVSLGGAAALLGGVAEKSDAIIIESVYPTIEEAIANRMTMRIGNLGKYLVPLFTLQFKPRLGISINELRPVEKIANAKGAIFVLNGSLDRHTTLAESKRLFENAHDPKLFWEVEGAAHIDFSRYAAKDYQKRVLVFFRKYLK